MARPKRIFSEKQIEEIADCAFQGCQNNTIASKLDIPVNTLTRHFGKLMTKKRAERKYNLRAIQTKQAITHPVMAIWLGKNELGQTDKASFEHSGPDGKPIPISIVDFRNVPTNDDTK